MEIKKLTTYFIIYCALITTYNCQDESERLLAELEIIDLELEDTCDTLSNALKSNIFQRNYKDKILAEEAYGEQIRSQAAILKDFSDIPTQVQRNWTFLIKPGDCLLLEEDWKSLVTFINENEELQDEVKIPCINSTDGCTFSKEEYSNILQNNKNVDLLNQTWSSWQWIFTKNKEKFSSILPLVNKAALLNDASDGRSYWEMLNDVEGAYANADTFWQEIEPFYKKLQGFVKTRLENYYNISEESQHIPVYLLGSNFGLDWSFVADTILPHPQIHYDSNTFLKYKNLEDIFKLTENLTQEMSLGSFGDKFWTTSAFNLSVCEPQILTFCTDSYTELFECNKSSWVTYLDAHETAMKITLKNREYSSFIRQNLRYSAVDEAIVNLGSILAIENLPFHGILNENAFNSSNVNDTNSMTKLLLTALRVLPRMAYYLAADKWRLQELENSSNNMAATWWNYRLELQGVKGVTNEEYDFLGDEYITSNKPYISKFLGSIISFQIFEYYKSAMLDPEANIAKEFGKDENFISMIRDRPTNDWPYLLTLNYGINEVLTEPLLAYFRPLEAYFDNAPSEQVPIITTTPAPITTTLPTVKSKLDKKSKKLVKDDVVLSDQPKLNATEKAVEPKNAVFEQSTIYVGVAILVVLSIVLVVAFVYKKFKKRSLPVNRRFET